MFTRLIEKENRTTEIHILPSDAVTNLIYFFNIPILTENIKENIQSSSTYLYTEKKN